MMVSHEIREKKATAKINFSCTDLCLYYGMTPVMIEIDYPVRNGLSNTLH